MTRMDKSRKLLIDAHQDWLGFVRPLGLVVAPSVLVDRQAIVDRNVRPRHGAFLELLVGEGENARVRDPRAVLTGFLGWRDEDLVGGDDLPEQFDRVLPELGVRLSADSAVPSSTRCRTGRPSRCWSSSSPLTPTSTRFPRTSRTAP